MTKREELIDFLKWYREEWTIPEYKKDEHSVDDYLFEKSNNSSTSDEALTLDNNEQIKKICPFSCDCHFKSNLTVPYCEVDACCYSTDKS